MSQECWYMALVAAARETEAARPCEQLRALKPNLGDTGGPHTKTKTNNQSTKQTKLGNGPHYLIFMTIDSQTKPSDLQKHAQTMDAIGTEQFNF